LEKLGFFWKSAEKGGRAGQIFVNFSRSLEYLFSLGREKVKNDNLGSGITRPAHNFFL